MGRLTMVKVRVRKAEGDLFGAHLPGEPWLGVALARHQMHLMQLRKQNGTKMTIMIGR
jgi:hypothetical protein